MEAVEWAWTVIFALSFLRALGFAVGAGYELREADAETHPAVLLWLKEDAVFWALYSVKAGLLFLVGLESLYYPALEPPLPPEPGEAVILSTFLAFGSLWLVTGEIKAVYRRRRDRLRRPPPDR